MLSRRGLMGAALAAVLLAGTAPFATAAQPMLIGGGAADGLQTLAARQICTLVNEHARETYGCIARPAPGSLFNIRAIEVALMEFGFAQPDRARDAVEGTGAWEGAPVAGLRSVFAVGAVSAEVVTGAGVAEDLVYDTVKIVFENLEVLRSTHPAFAELTPAAMLEGLAAPLHPGAARYYMEQGWLPP